MCGVNAALSIRGTTVEPAQQCAKEWRANSVIFAWFLCSFGPPSSTLVAYHLLRGGIPLYDAVGLNCKKGTTIENHSAGAWYMD